MPLQPVQLDTLNWDQMVSAIRTRVMADSSGQWTLHAPVDPGITLLEVFAWLLDQRVYWMDQVPDSLTRAVLALLGEAPQPAQAAITVFQFVPSDTGFLTVDAGTAMRLGDSFPPVVFSTRQPTVLLPGKTSTPGSPVNQPDVNHPKVRINGVDHSSDLFQKRRVALLAAGANSSQVQITLLLSEMIDPAFKGQSFSLLFELENPKDIPPQWTAEAVPDVPPPATLTWSYQTGPDAFTPFPAGQVEDGTAGLRRSGIVRLPIPADWQPGNNASPFAYAVGLQIANAAFTVVPRLTRLLANVALADHRWKQTKDVPTAGWLPLPGNVISLAGIAGDSGLELFPPIEDSVKVTIPKSDGSPNVKSYDWQYAADFYSYGPADRVFGVDRPSSRILFGDGLTGRVPIVRDPADAFDIALEFQAGGGPEGNVGQYLGWDSVQPAAGNPDFFFTATNVVPGEGGKDSETLDAARQRAEAKLKERNRAVCAKDFEDLATTTPGVAIRRAHATVGHHPLFPCLTMPGVVTVFVVPYAPREQTDGPQAEDLFVATPQPDPGAMAAVRARLDAARLAGTQVFVEPAVYRSVWLELQIASDSPLSPDLRRQIADGLRTYMDPLVGGDDGKGWPFGDPLRPSAFARKAQVVLGNAGDVLRTSICLKGMAQSESCQDVPIQPHELPKLEDVILHFQRRTPRGGGGLR